MSPDTPIGLSNLKNAQKESPLEKINTHSDTSKSGIFDFALSVYELVKSDKAVFSGVDETGQNDHIARQFYQFVEAGIDRFDKHNAEDSISYFNKVFQRHAQIRPADMNEPTRQVMQKVKELSPQFQQNFTKTEKMKTADADVR